MSMSSPGKNFKSLVDTEHPLKVVGVINAMAAKLAAAAGCKAIYLSGAGVANADYALPDLGLTALPEVIEAAKRITDAVDLPLLVDGDTGFGGTLNIAHAVKQMQRANIAAVHFEDQQWPKRCGHRQGKKLISQEEMCDKIKAAVDAKTDPDFVIMARTDALAVEGMEAALARAKAYTQAGADMIFAEAVAELSQYEQFVSHLVHYPVLANITEFGQTPLFTTHELRRVGVKLALYPLSAFRAMNHAALSVYQEIETQGTQQALIDQMQTREALYALINYHHFEALLDQSGH